MWRFFRTNCDNYLLISIWTKRKKKVVTRKIKREKKINKVNTYSWQIDFLCIFSIISFEEGIGIEL